MLLGNKQEAPSQKNNNYSAAAVFIKIYTKINYCVKFKIIVNEGHMQPKL